MYYILLLHILNFLSSNTQIYIVLCIKEYQYLGLLDKMDQVKQSMPKTISKVECPKFRQVDFSSSLLKALAVSVVIVLVFLHDYSL